MAHYNLFLDTARGGRRAVPQNYRASVTGLLKNPAKALAEEGKILSTSKFKIKHGLSNRWQLEKSVVIVARTKASFNNLN